MGKRFSKDMKPSIMSKNHFNDEDCKMNKRGNERSNSNSSHHNNKENQNSNSREIRKRDFTNYLQDAVHNMEQGSDPDRSRFMEGDVVLAIFDYEAQSEEELCFRKYDKFLISDADDSDWLSVRCEATGKHGYIPANYVSPANSLDIYDWYFGAINRREAESFLMDTEEGTFLIRDSFTNPGDFAVSLKFQHPHRTMPVRHYIIKHESALYSIWKKKYFSNLWELVNDYRDNPNGLPICLLYPYHKHAPIMTDLCRETKTDWEINRDDILLLRELGHGNFGNVYHGRWKGKTEVAVKTLRKGCMTDEEFLQEATIMKDLKHPNIVTLFATCSKSEPIYIITPFMENGALYDLLKRHQRTLFDVDQLLEFAFQISKGMHYLETKSLIHCDLAARNVLVDRSHTCKIADFGLAKILKGDGCSITTGKIPVKWSAPEVFARGEFSIKSDVWSFGIVVIEIFTHGEAVYKGMSKEEIRRNVANGYRLPKPDLCPAEIYEVLLKCWDKISDKRPSFRLLKNHLDDTCNKVIEGITYQAYTSDQ